MKKVVAVILSCFVFLTLSVSAYASSPIKVNIDGKEISFDVNPQSVNGRTMVPLRKIFESLNVEISWDEASQTITGRKDGFTIVLQIDNPVATINGKEVKLDVPATVIEGRTLVPVRFLAESTGSDVSWDDTTQTVLINRTTTEQLIKLALTSKETHVFQIQDDFVFDTAAAASTTRDFNTSKPATSSALPDNAAMNSIRGSIYACNVIRVNSNAITMDQDDRKCKLTVLEGDKGIEISISDKAANGGNGMSLKGIIKGNTLTASEDIIFTSLINHVGNTIGFYGTYRVSITELSKDQLPPVCVNNLKAKIQSHNSVLLSWDDPNSSDIVQSYDIYREYEREDKFTKVATVTNTTTWTDTSEMFRKVHGAVMDYYSADRPSYYIIVNAKNGKQSFYSKFATINSLEFFNFKMSYLDSVYGANH